MVLAHLLPMVGHLGPIEWQLPASLSEGSAQFITLAIVSERQREKHDKRDWKLPS
jgi:hypothetical protein